ncbi:hypothetical protein AB4Y44_18950 [Paraburkholderia sp. BR10937]|uniref:hypothetical protein n=1 Tax=Paraburkholderia sp. BR10937 TaxID=3236994 RepID=UPI0034D26184
MSDWADCRVDFIKLDGYTARLQVREYAAALDVILEKSSEAGDISIVNDTIVIPFTGQDTEAMAAVARHKNLPNSEKRAPLRRVGVYELRLYSPDDEPYSLLRGDVNLIVSTRQTHRGHGFVSIRLW